MRNLILIVLLALALAAFSWWYLALETSNVDPAHKVPQHDEYGLHEFDEGQKSMAGKKSGHIADPESESIEPDRQRHSQEAVASGTDHDTDPFIDTQSLEEFMETAQVAHGWSNNEVRANTWLWEEACKKAEALRGSGTLDPEFDRDRYLEIDLRYAQQADLGRFCSEYTEYLERTLQVERNIISRQPTGYEFDEILRNEGRMEATIAVISSMNDALKRLDEASVTSRLLFIAHNKLIEPPISDAEVNTHALYETVFMDVAAALICQEIGGCRGERHPMVLRQCMSRYERGIACYRPSDIDEAIYQVQTPLERLAFISMLDQVNGLISSFRRNNG